MELAGDEIDRILDSWPVARLATQRADGLPSQVPIVFARSGERLWSPIDGKPKGDGELARVRNIRARPGVSLLIDHYAEDWERLWWLRVEGVAEVICPSDLEGDAEVAGAVAALRNKYPQYRDTALFRGVPTLVAVRPLVIRSWRAGLV